MTYSCVCYTCKISFESENELDVDEYSYCSSCFGEQKALRAELDAKIKPVPTPKQEMRWIPAAVPGGKLYLHI